MNIQSSLSKISKELYLPISRRKFFNYILSLTCTVSFGCDSTTSDTKVTRIQHETLPSNAAMPNDIADVFNVTNEPLSISSGLTIDNISITVDSIETVI